MPGRAGLRYGQASSLLRVPPPIGLRLRALATHLLAFGVVVKNKVVVVVGSVDPGDSGLPCSPERIPETTGPVRRQWPAGDCVWTPSLSPPDACQLPPGSPVLSSYCPKRVHRDIHSLCVPIVTGGTDTWRLTLTAPAA